MLVLRHPVRRIRPGNIDDIGRCGFRTDRGVDKTPEGALRGSGYLESRAAVLELAILKARYEIMVCRVQRYTRYLITAKQGKKFFLPSGKAARQQCNVACTSV